MKFFTFVPSRNLSKLVLLNNFGSNFTCITIQKESHVLPQDREAWRGDEGWTISPSKGCSIELMSKLGRKQDFMFVGPSFVIVILDNDNFNSKV